MSTISTRVQRRRVETCMRPTCQFRELLQFRFTLVGVTEFLVKHFYPTVQPLPLGFMNTKQKPVVAVVEDDRSLASLIDEQLSEAGFATHVFHKGGSALKHLEANHAHLVLLDLALPDMDGMELFARMQRLRAPVPVVILSATDSDIVVARALDAGADDYIRKPFNGTELCARLRAVLRRTETARDLRLTRNADLATGVFDFGTAQVHPERLELEFKDGRRCKIGRKELGILFHLHANPGVIVSRHALIHSVWGVHADIRSRSLDQYVVKIRELFGKHGASLNCFRTIHGIGYWYEPGQ